MARSTTRLGLNVWDLTSDPFDHTELADNWDLIDDEVGIAKGFEILATLPTTGNFPGRIVMLSSPDGGFRAWTLCRYDGSSWAPMGAIEIHATLPINPYDGRIIILSNPDGGFDAWTMLRYVGSEWRPIGDISISDDNQSVVTGASRINLIEGDGITYTIADDNSNERVDVTVSAAVAAVAIKKNGTLIGSRQTINLVEGANVTLTVTSETAEINVTPNVASPPGQPGTELLAFGYRNETGSSEIRLGGPDSGVISTWYELDTNNLDVTFTVPTSGQVMLVMSGNAKSLHGSNRVRWGVTTGGGSLVTGTALGLANDMLDGEHIVARRLITGLTPASTPTWYWATQWGQVYVGTNWSPATIQIFQVD